MFRNNVVAAYIAQKPRLIGITFALLVLLIQAGNVAARASHITITGP